MYLCRFGQKVTIGGVTEQIGIRWLDDSGGLSVLLYGVYLDPNYAAATSVFFGIYSAALFFACRKGMFSKPWKNVLAQVFAAANLLTQLCYFPLANSRGAWVSLIAAGVIVGVLYLYFVMFRHGAWKKILAFVITVVVIGVSCAGLIGLRNTLSYFSARYASVAADDVENENKSRVQPRVDSFEKQDDGTGSGRLIIWKEALTLFARKPLFGTGPRNNQYYMLKYGIESVKIAMGTGVHNSYLDVLLEYGTVGAGLLFGFFAICLKDVLKRIFSKTERDGSYYLVLLGALAVCCTSLFLSASFINTTAMYYLMLISIGYLITVRKNDNGGANK